MAAGAQWFLRTTSHCLPSKQVLGSAKADVGKSTWWQADEFAQVGPIGHEGTGRWGSYGWPSALPGSSVALSLGVVNLQCGSVR